LPRVRDAFYLPDMSTKSRAVIFGSRIRGAKIRAEGAREEAVKANRAADRAWSIQKRLWWASATVANHRAMSQWRM
jgi:hypothetical protein